MRITVLVFLFLSITTVLSAQITTIPDSNFEQALIDLGHDDVLDGEVLNSNIAIIENLVVQDYDISELTGIESFTSLKSLNCYSNQITSLDLTQNVLLEDLNCSNNFLPVLDLTQNPELTTINCVGSEIASLDVTQNSNLEYLYCPINMLTSLDLSQNPLLYFLGCQENQITSLDLSNNPLLTTLYCHENNLSCLNVNNGNNEDLWDFTAYFNPQLTCIEGQ